MQDDSYNFLKAMPPKAKAGLRRQAIEAVVSSSAIQSQDHPPGVIGGVNQPPGVIDEV